MDFKILIFLAIPPPSLNHSAHPSPFISQPQPKPYPHSQSPLPNSHYIPQTANVSAQRSQSPYPTQPPINQSEIQNSNSNSSSNQIIDYSDPDSFPKEYKKEGSDWIAMYNPQSQRSLDVSLVHNLVHESVVCCVRFSDDGKYLATGCNRSAQIYDTKTGAKVSILIDENVQQKGDLYIRSVCFSPDSKFLATGAEDKQIRVSFIIE